jgi:hypothetical protein
MKTWTHVGKAFMGPVQTAVRYLSISNNPLCDLVLHARRMASLLGGLGRVVEK